MFQSLELKDGGSVKFGGNQKGKIVGSGTISNGNLPSISNVLFVEGVTHNLLSISQLSDSGYDIIFNQKSCRALQLSCWEFSQIMDIRWSFGSGPCIFCPNDHSTFKINISLIFQPFDPTLFGNFSSTCP